MYLNKFLLSCVLLCVFSALSCNAQGAEWTKEEELIIKQKLFRFAKKTTKVIDEYLELHPNYTVSHSKAWPTFQKVLRLGFHDCLKYKDPVDAGHADGCDGCLNAVGMNINLEEEFGAEMGSWNGPDITLTNNNGLLATADFLEEIFTNPNFPSKVPSLPVSMKDSGKSRADLWAFAALFAAKYGIDNNNLGCKGTPRKGCGNLQDEFEDCEISMPRDFKFKTGRIDCAQEPESIRPFLTTKPEIHPNAAGNGPDTVNFHKDNFNLTARQTIALVGGAHSVGGFNQQNSLHNYRWTRRQETILNNQLFRHYAEKDQYFYECIDQKPFRIGDAYGNIPKTYWTVVALRRSVSGGPFQWFHTYERCPATDICLNNFADMAGLGEFERGEPDAPDACCQNLEPGMQCRPECVGPRRKGESAMSAETGFYRKFKTDPVTGLPFGCPVFDNDAKWMAGQRQNVVPDCDKEDYAPEGEPLFQIVEEFAEDKQSWINTFVTSLEKMVENGYSDHDLAEIQA